MTKISFVLFAALAAAGCKKGGAGGGDCDKAISHSMDLAKDDMKKMGVDDATMGKMVDIGKQRCKEDKWSAEAITCMIGSKTEADAQGCYDKLTADQRDKMNKAAMAAQPATPPPTPTAPTPTETGSAMSGSGGATAGSGSATP